MLGEYSDAALKICRQNIRRNGLSGRVVPMFVNALEKPEKSLGEFRCIVSNPPYIPREDIAGLDTSVRDYEPHLALFGGEDGLDFYRSIVMNYGPAIKPGGYLCFEFGQGQEDAVCWILEANDYEVLELRKDTGGITRAVLAKKKERNDEYGDR